MAERKKDITENYGDFSIADDNQIADMQREYALLGVTGDKNQSRLCTYPLPVYMREHCHAFCKSAKEMLVILNMLDQIFASRNKKSIDFIQKSLIKTSTAIALKCDLTQEINLTVNRMPIKQSLYRLLQLHNSMSIALDELSQYDKSVNMQEVITRHLLVGSVLHGLCI